MKVSAILWVGSTLWTTCKNWNWTTAHLSQTPPLNYCGESPNMYSINTMMGDPQNPQNPQNPCYPHLT